MSGFTEQQIDFMRQACLLCDNSCLEVRTGCLVVREPSLTEDGSGPRTVRIEGWNKSVHSLASKNQDLIHAEQMVVNRALNSGISLKNSTVYVTRFPCDRCSSLLVEQGITRIFYMSDHFTGGNSSLGFLEKQGVKVAQIPEEEVWK